MDLGNCLIQVSAQIVQINNGRQNMSKATVKAVVSIEVPLPKSTVEKQKTAEVNAEVKERAEELLIDALTLANLEPAILRIRIARQGKEE
jgi:hypothetical protein